MDSPASTDSSERPGERPPACSLSEAKKLLTAEEWEDTQFKTWSSIAKTSVAAPFVYLIVVVAMPWVSGDFFTSKWPIFALAAVGTMLVGVWRLHLFLNFKRLYRDNAQGFKRSYYLGQILSVLGLQLCGCAMIWYHGSGWPALVFNLWIIGTAAGAGFALAALPQVARRAVAGLMAPPILCFALLGGFPGRVVAVISAVQLLFTVSMCRQLSERFWSRKLAFTLIQRYAAKVEQTNEELRCAKQVHARFLSRMNHELRTPLNGIQGCAELLSEDPEIRKREELGLIVQSSERLRRLYDHLFLVVDIDAGKLPTELENVDLWHLKRDCEMTHYDDIERSGVHIDWQCEADGPIVAQPRVLRFVLGELIHNICVHSGAKRASVKIAVRDKNLEIAVQDDGVGIPEAYRLQLFRRFENGMMVSRLHGEGAGLGLALCRELAESLGGSLGLDDGLERGTTFVLKLPIGEVPETEPSEPSTPVCLELSA